MQRKTPQMGRFLILSQALQDQVPRQDPGKNLDGTVVMVVLTPLTAAVLPQTHLNNGSAVVGAPPAELTGTKLTVLPSMVVSPMLPAATVTITPPAASVATEPTYLDVAVELSQPQAPAAGKLAAELL